MRKYRLELYPGEEVLYEIRISNIYVLLPVIAGFLALVAFVVLVVLMADNDFADWFSFVPLAILIFFVWMLVVSIKRIFYKISFTGAITNKQAIIRSGIIRKESNKAGFDARHISQGLLGRIFNYGTVSYHYKGIDKPNELRKFLFDRDENSALRVKVME